MLGNSDAINVFTYRTTSFATGVEKAPTTGASASAKVLNCLREIRNIIQKCLYPLPMNDLQVAQPLTLAERNKHGKV